jgi:toxin ParE1/3/4
LDAAIARYESELTGLGLDLHVEVLAAFATIQGAPHRWPRHKNTSYRKCHVHRFPFIIFYLELADTLWIAAISHGKRRPDYWRRRKPE